jgi:hypothetical protein
MICLIRRNLIIMRYHALPLFIVVFTLNTALCQDAPPIVWDTVVHNFGVIKKGIPNHYRFVFKNVSDQAIYLDNVRTNCKCILPYWDNKSVPPNEEGEIFIVLTVQKSGIFKKGVLVSFDGYPKSNQLEVWGYTNDVDDLVIQKSVRDRKTDVPNGNIGQHQPINNQPEEDVSEDVPGDPYRKKQPVEPLPDVYDNKNEAPKEDKFGNMTKREQAMIEEINLLRTNPKGYVVFIEDYILVMEEALKEGVSKKLERFYKSEIKAANEAIKELKNTPALSQLEPHEGVYAAAKQHGRDMINNKFFDHIGSDGSKPWERIIENAPSLSDGNENLVGGPYEIRQSIIILLVDAGVQGRGHRKTLLNPSWQFVACYELGEMNGIENCWIQNFATE